VSGSFTLSIFFTLETKVMGELSCTEEGKEAKDPKRLLVAIV
jgi:hypothetical protein